MENNYKQIIITEEGITFNGKFIPITSSHYTIEVEVSATQELEFTLKCGKEVESEY